MARLFDNASSEYLEIDSAVLTSPPITMACWFNSDDITNLQALLMICDASAGNQGFWLLIHGGNDDKILLWHRGGASQSLCYTTTSYSANTWHHACGIVRSASDRSSYLDAGGRGDTADSVTSSGLDRTAIGALRDSTPDFYMSGRIAEAAIWNVALTDAEVAVLAKGYSPLFVRPQNLVAYWPLIRDEDQDRVGGYDLTDFNTPSIAAHPPVIYPVSPFVGVAAAEEVHVPRHPSVLYQIPAIY